MKHNHLLKFANTPENRALVDIFREAMDRSDSKWRLELKGRKPVKGVRYGHGGNVKLKDSQEFAVYVRPRRRVRIKEVEYSYNSRTVEYYNTWRRIL